MFRLVSIYISRELLTIQHGTKVHTCGDQSRARKISKPFANKESPATRMGGEWWMGTISYLEPGWLGRFWSKYLLVARCSFPFSPSSSARGWQVGFQNSRLFKKKKRKHESPTETKRERINVLNGRPHAGECFFHLTIDLVWLVAFVFNFRRSRPSGNDTSCLAKTRKKNNKSET